VEAPDPREELSFSDAWTGDAWTPRRKSRIQEKRSRIHDQRQLIVPSDAWTEDFWASHLPLKRSHANLAIEMPNLAFFKIGGNFDDGLNK
jgi:hypothetical protein